MPSLSYQKACEILEKTKQNNIYFGLERMEILLQKLGNPHLQTKSIHLAGTNGKGSTLTYLRSILQEAGYQVGTFTSPYIFERRDQIQINGESIASEDFVTLLEQLLPIMKELEQSSYGAPVEFEVISALAFMYFAQRSNLDIMIIETGLGGRLDPTNVLTPLVSIITNISYDHMQFLGNDLLQIAKEKAGIIKATIPIVSGCQQPSVRSLLQETAFEKQAQLHERNRDFTVNHHDHTFTYKSEQHTYKDLQLNMLGKHQQENAALAIRTIELLKANHDFDVTEAALRRGLIKAKIENRIERVQQTPTIIMDGGHNSEGITALVNTLTSLFPSKKFIVLFSTMNDKDVEDMLERLQPLTEMIIITTFPHERSLQRKNISEEILNQENIIFEENYKTTFHQLRDKLKQDDVLVVTGSLNFLSFIRAEL